MKVIHIVLGKANPNRMNGVNRVAHELATFQKLAGHNVEIWGIANDVIHNYPERNFDTHLFLQQKFPFSLDSRLEKDLKNLSRTNIVHLHGAFIPAFYKIARILKRNSVKYVFTPHGSFSEAAMQKSSLKKRIYFKIFEKFIVKNAFKVQLLGKSEFDYLDKLVKNSKKILIPNGQNMDDIPEAEQRGDSSPIIFGFLGRLDINHKGLDLMLKGFHKYKNNGGNGRLNIIGDSVERSKLEHLAKTLKIEDDVFFLGKKFAADKYDELSKMDVFLHTSRMEGFPTAVLEAGAMRLPLITSLATNVNEMIIKYDAGFPYTNNNPMVIAEMMMEAEKEHREGILSIKGHNAYKMVTTEYDWMHIGNELVNVYKNAVAKVY